MQKSALQGIQDSWMRLRSLRVAAYGLHLFPGYHCMAAPLIFGLEHAKGASTRSLETWYCQAVKSQVSGRAFNLCLQASTYKHD